MPEAAEYGDNEGNAASRKGSPDLRCPSRKPRRAGSGRQRFTQEIRSALPCPAPKRHPWLNCCPSTFGRHSKQIRRHNRKVGEASTPQTWTFLTAKGRPGLARSAPCRSDTRPSYAGAAWGAGPAPQKRRNFTASLKPGLICSALRRCSMHVSLSPLSKWTRAMLK